MGAGIYRIDNTQNGRYYYGSSVNLLGRWGGHCRDLKAGRHSNRFLQADYRKCGADAFVFSVVEHLPRDRDALLKRELAYLALYFDNGMQCYNLTMAAVSRAGSPNAGPRPFKRRGPLSEVTKRKISAANSGTENGMYGKPGPRRGVKLSAETKEKLRAYMTGRKRGPYKPRAVVIPV